MVEKGERLPRLQRLQPQVHAAELGRHRVHVHAVQAAADDIAERMLVEERRRLALAGRVRAHPGEVPGEAMRRAHQEVAGTDRRVADLQIEDRPLGVGAGLAAHRRLHHRVQRRVQQALHQVVDAVTGRLWGPPGGSQVTLGGRSIDLSAPSADTADARRTLAGALGAQRGAEDDDPLAGPGSWEAAWAGSWDDPETGATVRGMTGRELLLGSSFHLAAGGGEAGGPGYAAWGRVAVGGFDAEAPADGGTLRLDGEVTTGILGADAEWERWLAGVALSVSSAEGTFDQPGVDSGTVESTLTSVNPYVRYEASDRLSVWGLLGYGTGDMTIRGNSPVRTDLMLRLGAAGARGVLLEADEDGGIDLALRGDAFLVQMESEAAANTVETKADASRLRLVLEAGRSFALGEGAVLAPALELGLRHDGGDAETGTGVKVGGRIRYTDTGSGLAVEANARTLVAHEDSGYREWGAGGSVRLDPGASGRGLSLTIAPVWGTPSSGVDRLWSARDAAGLAPDEDFEAERRLEGEIGYGFGAFGGRGVVTPYGGLGLTAAGDRTWREPANDDAPEHGVQFRFTLRW